MSFAVSAAKLLTDVKISSNSSSGSGSGSSNLACKANPSHLQCNDMLLDSSNNRGLRSMDPLDPLDPLPLPSRQCLLHNVQRHKMKMKNQSSISLSQQPPRAPGAGGAGNIPQQSLPPYGMLQRQQQQQHQPQQFSVTAEVHLPQSHDGRQQLQQSSWQHVPLPSWVNQQRQQREQQELWVQQSWQQPPVASPLNIAGTVQPPQLQWQQPLWQQPPQAATYQYQEPTDILPISQQGQNQ